MSKHNYCDTEIIAQSTSCTISRCAECNTYHLHIGPMSLRLKKEVFDSISNTIINAQMMIIKDSEQTPGYHQMSH